MTPMVDTSKYEGKTAAELVEMLKAQESFQGEQSKVIGELRTAVRSLDAQAKAAAVRHEETGSTRKDQYRTITRELADEAILSPEKGLGKLMDITRDEAVNEAEKRVMNRINQKQQMDAQIDAFLQANPVLHKWKDVFSVAGTNIYNQNPGAPLGEILAEAKKVTLEWMQSKGIKPEDDGTKVDRVKAGITTSGGSGSRDTEPERGREEESRSKRANTGNEDNDNILNAISEIKTWKANRMLPPRSR